MASRKATWLCSIPRSTLSKAARYMSNLRLQRRAGRSHHALGGIATSDPKCRPPVWSNCGRLREIARLRFDAPEKGASAMDLLTKCHHINCWGTAMELLVMRPLTSVLVVLILSVAPVTVASAQLLTCVQGTCSSHPPLPLPFPPLANLPSPDPSTLANRIPAPLPAPSQSSAINGPMSQPDLTPLPVPAAPVTPAAPPSVFQSTPVPSVFQSQTGL
jgi:hypothetical protein